MIEVNAAALATHPFLHGMPANQLGMLAEAARDVSFPARVLCHWPGGTMGRGGTRWSAAPTMDQRPGRTCRRALAAALHCAEADGMRGDSPAWQLREPRR